MKTFTIITAAVLALNANLLFASYLNPTHPITKVYAFSMLAPSVPMEAAFEDAVTELDYSALAPATPAEATFEDATAKFSGLAPVILTVADFDDSFVANDYSILAPAYPMIADFD